LISVNEANDGYPGEPINCIACNANAGLRVAKKRPALEQVSPTLLSPERKNRPYDPEYAVRLDKNSGSMSQTLALIRMAVVSRRHIGVCSDLRNTDFLQFRGDPFFPGLNINLNCANHSGSP